MDALFYVATLEFSSTVNKVAILTKMDALFYEKAARLAAVKKAASQSSLKWMRFFIQLLKTLDKQLIPRRNPH